MNEKLETQNIIAYDPSNSEHVEELNRYFESGLLEATGSGTHVIHRMDGEVIVESQITLLEDSNGRLYTLVSANHLPYFLGDEALNISQTQTRPVHIFALDEALAASLAQPQGLTMRQEEEGQGDTLCYSETAIERDGPFTLEVESLEATDLGNVGDAVQQAGLVLQSWITGEPLPVSSHASFNPNLAYRIEEEELESCPAR